MGICWEGEDLCRFTKQSFDEFLLWCFDNKVSDILIEVGEVVGAKINGEVQRVGKKVISYQEICEILMEIYQHASPTLIKSGQPQDFSYSILRESSETDEELIGFRVNATACAPPYGASDGVVMVLRIIPGNVPHYKDLEIPDEIMDATKAKYGIILITGPTGSGKSTTIAAMLREIIETRPSHVITYENPIEFNLKNIKNKKAWIGQSEVPTNITDFRAATVNSLRRAPDIILYGEGRDKSTISACIREAQFGHLVLSTIHTNSIAGTISRMADEFDPSERRGVTAKLIDAMRLIVHQRLYPRLGGGRVVVREYLTFNDEMRRHLQMCLLDKDDLRVDIDKQLEMHGRPLLVDAIENFKRGNLDLSQYALIINEIGNPKRDMAIVGDVAKNLYSVGKIDKKLFDSWMNIFLEIYK